MTGHGSRNAWGNGRDRQHQAEVIDAGRRHRRRRLGLWNLPMHMPTEDERDRLASRMAFPIDVHQREALRIKAQLNASSDERLVDGVAIAGQRDRGGLRHMPHDRPAKRVAQQRRLDGAERPWLMKRSIGVWPVSAC